MNTRTLLNVGLVVLVAVLAALVYFQPGLQQEPVAPLMTKLNPKQIKEVRLSNEHGEVVLQRQGESWSLVSPMKIAANEFRVDRLLRWLVVSSEKSYAASGLDLAKFGLDHPQAVLQADGVELRFGNLDPLNHRRYLLYNDQIHLVADSDLTTATSPWNYFVSPLIVPKGAQIKSLAVPGLGEVSQGEKGWHYSGKMPPASADLMQTLVDDWSNARALSVEPVSSKGSHEVVVITFEDDRPPLKLKLVRSADELVLIPADLGVEYHLAPEQANDLFKWVEPAKPEVK